VLTLAAVNVLAAVVFAGLYAAGGSGRLPSPVFVVALPVAFVAATVLWVRVEDRSVARDLLSRVGRAVIGLLAVVIGLPIVVLMPLFWLESQLPPEAVPALHLGPVMALLLAALVLVVAVNLVGALTAVAVALGRRWRRRATG
jgi:hypothetical protein